MAKEGVPEGELVSVKMRSGPIPCGVAGGISVNAKAEWASLIPLADGGVHPVRGLTMQNVTQEMLEIFNAIKKQHKDVKEIPVNPRCSACIGGPVRALEDASHKFGCNVLNYIIQLTQVMPSYKPRLKFFPENQAYEKDLIDDDISGIRDVRDQIFHIETETET